MEDRGEESLLELSEVTDATTSERGSEEEDEGTETVYHEIELEEERSAQESGDQDQIIGTPQRTDATAATSRKTTEDKQCLPIDIAKLTIFNPSDMSLLLVGNSTPYILPIQIMIWPLHITKFNLLSKNLVQRVMKNHNHFVLHQDYLKTRTRAFTGAFVVMVSPVLLAIVLKKVNLKCHRQYKGRRILGVVVDFVQRNFAHFAAVTLQMGISPFLCVMISEACADVEITSRWLAVSKLMVFLSDIFLMVLGCAILLLINMNASSVVSACFVMATLVIVVHICSCCRHLQRDTAGGTVNDSDHSKLEHSLDFSAGITVIMFLVLESVALDGLLRRTQPGPGLLPHRLAPLLQPRSPSQAPVPAGVADQQGRETLLGATMFISFMTSAWGALVMNIWTVPLRVGGDAAFTGAFMTGLNVALAVAAVAVVVSIAWEGLQLVAWLTLFPPFIPLLVLLLRASLCHHGNDVDIEQQQEGSPLQDGAARPEEPSEDQKPAPLELTKVAFTGFLAVAVPSVTNTALGVDGKAFVFFTAAAVLSGLLWRLLTHAPAPSRDVLKAANQASTLAHGCVFCAGIAFWSMAVNALS
ncbi:hypothetical protein ACP70R_029951 [Stipagrostis hirtigluma subsp. patula]